MSDPYADALGIKEPGIKAPEVSRTKIDPALQKSRDGEAIDILHQEHEKRQGLYAAATTEEERVRAKADVESSAREIKALGGTPKFYPAPAPLKDLYAAALGVDGPAPAAQQNAAPNAAPVVPAQAPANPPNSLAQSFAKAPIPSIRLAAMLAQTKGPEIINRPPDASSLIDAGKSLAKSTIGLGDFVANGVGGMIKQVEYAGSRAYGNTPEEATRQSNDGVGSYFENPVSKLANSANRFLTGSTAKVEDSAAYKNESSQRIMKFVGENIGKGADWISGKTGLPKSDVENMMNTAVVGVTPVLSKGVGKAVTGIKQSYDGAMQELSGTKPLSSVLDNGKPPVSKPAAGKYDIVPPPAQYGSVGASGSNIMTRISAASPEVKADAMAQIKQAKATYGNDWEGRVHWEALDRHLNADSLAIPGRLTNAQATQDAALIAQQWNERGRNGMEPTFDMQNKVMADNLKDIKGKSTPDVYDNSHAAYSDTAIAAYKKLHAEEKGSIDAKWNKIREVSSDQTIFDADAMLKDSEAALVKRKLTTHDPDGQLTELRKSAKSGGMNADEFVNWRQNLGRVAMKGGNEGAAAKAILEASNKSKLHPEAEQYRGMVNEALAEGKALHDKIKNDPAYKAVVDGKASRDNFVQNHVINGKSENLAVMRDNLAHDDVASQSLRAAMLDHLRDIAGLNDKYEGTFSARAFDKRVREMTTRGSEIFKDGELQRLGALGQYASDAKFNSASSTKNWGNTYSAGIATPADAAIATAGDMVGNLAEGVLAAKTYGVSRFLTGPMRAAAKAKAEAKAAAAEQQVKDDYLHKATRPAAGLIK